MAQPVNTIICGDCIEELAGLQKPIADLVFADPPFNIGYKYDRYRDKRQRKTYVEWTASWMKLCSSALKPHGTMYIAIGDNHAADVKKIADRLGLSMRNWIIWHYTFGQQTKNKFARSHTHILYFVKNSRYFTFNASAIRIPSDRQLVYNDRRANAGGKMPDDVWKNYPRVCGTFKEREGWHPCQMPLLLLQRIVATSSNPGDLVLDPFAGSGTTAVAAAILGRKYLGIELSMEYTRQARQRLHAISQCPAGTTLTAAELKRLFYETGISKDQLVCDRKLLDIFCRQFKARTNGGRELSPSEMLAAIKELGL
jgi:site-specific DNA-methyltransferase (adenine-specific)